MTDWYENRLRSEGYLASRREKAKVIAHLCEVGSGDQPLSHYGAVFALSQFELEVHDYEMRDAGCGMRGSG